MIGKSHDGLKMMNMKLWQPIQVGDIKLNHRLAMAPMTRSRSAAQGVPTDLNAEYYAQRASMALIISEGTQPSEDGQGYLFTPGIYTDEQVIGWRKVTDAVHGAGGQMFIQFDARWSDLPSGEYAARQAGGSAVRCQAQHEDGHSFGAAGHSRAAHAPG
jgi:2,4-dienoyl-CoA reductase-like NADH-dependent reductase (Old Yellow Enzyme family)